MGRLQRRTWHYWRGTKQVSDPYDAYIPHRIAAWTPTPDSQTIERVGVAGELLRSWAQNAPRSKALAWCLQRTEGIASSEVEGIQTTLKSLSLLESLRATRSPARAETDRQALGNVRLNAYAIAVGQRHGDPVSVTDIEEMHRRLFAATAQQPESGAVRGEQNWVGRRGQRTPARAHFVPPPHEIVPSLLDDAMRYVSAPVWGHPIAKAALAHLQFETIHPFLDGNGRVGRALIHTVMHRDVGPSVALPLSAAIGARKDDYYESLHPYQTYIGDADASERSQAACATIGFVADAVAVACHYGQVVAQVVGDMEQSWTDLGLRSHSTAAAILVSMSTMPAVTTPYLGEVTGQSSRAIRRAVADLIDRGAVAESTDEDSGHRVFELADMLRVVDERRDLLLDCWDLHASGAREVVPEVLERFRGVAAGLQEPPSWPGTDTSESARRVTPRACGASTASGGICTHQVRHGTQRCPAGHTPA